MGIDHRHHRLHPWNSLGHGLLLGIVVAVFAPLGDLVESMLKRDLGLKDFGTHPPGSRGCARPLRRDAVLPARGLLPGGRARAHLMRRSRASSGSTGSIGTQALDVVRNHRDEYEVVALAAARNGELLRAQAEEFGVPLDSARLCADTPDVLTELASLPEVDVVLNAVVGFAGLPATLAALEHGKRLALANKESLIAGGPVVAAVRERGDGRDRPRRQRALRALPVPARRPTPTRCSGSCSPPAAGRSAGYSREQLAAVTVRRRAASTPPGTWAPRSPSTRRRS